MRVQPLTTETAPLWFEAAGLCHDPAEADHLAHLLRPPPLRPALRAVIEHDGRLIGAFAAERRMSDIRFWCPRFRADVSATEREEGMRCAIAALAALRASAGLAHLSLETRPTDDQPHAVSWFKVLRAAGFAELSAFRVHMREDLARVGVPPAAEIAVRAAAPRDRERLPALYAAAYADTLDRRPRALDAAADYIRELEAFGAGYRPDLWLVAALRGDAVGFVLVNPAHEAAFPGLSAWVLEIGCLPRHRGRGVAGALLAAAIPRAHAIGCRRLLATIDDLNMPSLRLHAAFGFVPRPERHYLFQRQ
jgi:GNAT superfamily N-acetyltransferase